MAGPYHKATFDRISEAKRARILDAATREFAAKGFRGTNINTIAAEAGISVGSVYKYFASKEDLFLTVIDEGYRALDKTLWEIIADEGDIYQKIERILRAAITYSRENPRIIQIYLTCTTEGLSHLSPELSRKIETITAQYYQSLIATFRSKGLVALDVDEAVAAFCLDSLFVIFQFSYACTYYQERLKIFVGPQALNDDERLLQGLMQFIRRALS